MLLPMLTGQLRGHKRRTPTPGQQKDTTAPRNDSSPSCCAPSPDGLCRPANAHTVKR